MRHFLLTLSCLAFTLPACSNQRPNLAAKVEPDKARTTLTQTLDAWKAGKTPDDLKLSCLPRICNPPPFGLGSGGIIEYPDELNLLATVSGVME